MALTNFIILSSRKTPFTAMDFYLIKDAIKVAGLYVSVIQIILIALLVIAVIAGLVFLWRKAPKLEVTIKKTKFVAYDSTDDTCISCKHTEWELLFCLQELLKVTLVILPRHIRNTDSVTAL